MSKFQKFLRDLFRKETAVYQAPFLHESFDFNAESEDYILWNGDSNHTVLNQIIQEANTNNVLGEPNAMGIDYLKSNKLSGISLQCNHFDFEKRDYIFLSTHLIQNLKNRGYVLSLKEIKSRKYKGNIEESIKAYLKPSRKLLKNDKAEQVFGNISIELISINEKLNRYNVSCSYYQDQNFNDPLDFSEFINHTFKS